MLIQEEPFRHWMNHFYGYGSWESPIWFIAHEEPGGDLPEEVAEKLTYFSNVHPGATTPTLCDIRELYKEVAFRVDGPRSELFSTLYEYRFGRNAVLHGIWKNLIAFVHGYQDKEISDLLPYQKNNFALASAKNETLIKLYPLPSPHAHAWYYAWLDLPEFGFLKTRAMYQDHLYNERIDTILNRIKTIKPEVVLMYGMENINRLKKSVEDYFPAVKFKMVKGTELQTPQHHRADLQDTTLLITTQIPALRHNRKETGFDWLDFGKMVKQEKDQIPRINSKNA